MGATLCSGARASRHSGFSCCRVQALGTVSLVTAQVQELWFMGLQSVQASVAAACGLRSCGSPALEQALRSCGEQAWLPCSRWDLSGPGVEPVSSALALAMPA